MFFDDRSNDFKRLQREYFENIRDKRQKNLLHEYSLKGSVI